MPCFRARLTLLVFGGDAVAQCIAKRAIPAHNSCVAEHTLIAMRRPQKAGGASRLPRCERVFA